MVIEMCKYYHITSYENLESISKDGLVPRSGGRTRSIGDKRCAIFLSKGITNSILMYSCLLHHYNSYTGERGLKAIEYYKDEIELYNEREKEVSLLEDELAEKEAIIKAIDWINEIMEYNDFSDYIGEGVYLTISDITDVISNDEKDCYTTKTIPPEKIKIVLLKNKITGEIIDSRENILSYFMSITPIESIIESTHNVVTIKVIKELYNNKINDIAYYNSNNFEMEEVPICMYLANNKENNKKI